MARDLSVSREKSGQPDRKTTKKSQKRYQASDEYDPKSLNSELDLIHDRINGVQVEAEVAPSVGGDESDKINEIILVLQNAGLIKK